MRSALFVAMLVASAALLSGCAKKEEDNHEFTCPDGKVIDLEQYPDHHNATFSAVSHCAKSSTSKSGSAGNSTSLPPNKLPVLVLTIKDSGGNKTNVTMLNGNLTFDATGSTDPDGAITGIAVTIQDSNTTRTGVLYDGAKKVFKTATFKLDRAGVVNITVAMVDDRAGFTVNQTHAYVNQAIGPLSQTVALAGGDQVTDACKGSPLPQDNGGAAVDAVYSHALSLTVVSGVTYIEAVGTGDRGAPEITICSPDYSTDAGCQCDPVSNSGTSVVTNVPLTAPMGINGYTVFVTSPTTPQNAITVNAIVHYDPQPAA